MRNLLSISIVSLLLAMPMLSRSTPASDHTQHNPANNPLLGTWRLAWLEQEDAQGQIHRPECTGLLVYTREGRMSVQVMFQNSGQSTDAQPSPYAAGGYEASFGTYLIVAGAHRFTFHVEGALVRSLVGQDLSRLYQLSGRQLIVKSTDPHEHWRVGWEHL